MAAYNTLAKTVRRARPTGISFSGKPRKKLGINLKRKTTEKILHQLNIYLFVVPPILAKSVIFGVWKSVSNVVRHDQRGRRDEPGLVEGDHTDHSILLFCCTISISLSIEWFI